MKIEKNKLEIEPLDHYLKIGNWKLEILFLLGYLPTLNLIKIRWASYKPVDI